MQMVVGNKYNWKYQNERLIYLGKHRGWNQFALVTEPDDVWCEVLDSDLHMLEETKQD